MPVHWGGDSTSSYESMAETLRGGLSLAMSGFGSGVTTSADSRARPTPASTSAGPRSACSPATRGSTAASSYRVPWAFDEEAVEVTRTFTHLKLRLMPYLYAAGLEASATGIPVMRPMQLEFPDDPAVAYLDRQYMLGPDILVAPVFGPDGVVDFYLPRGRWTSMLDGTVADGGTWHRERHGYLSLPLYVREGAVSRRRLDRPSGSPVPGRPPARDLPGRRGIAHGHGHRARRALGAVPGRAHGCRRAGRRRWLVLVERTPGGRRADRRR